MFRNIIACIISLKNIILVSVKQSLARVRCLVQVIRNAWRRLDDDDKKHYCKIALFFVIFFGAEMSGIMPGHHIVVDIHLGPFYDTVWSKIGAIFNAAG
jgi:hypothetical protein